MTDMILSLCRLPEVNIGLSTRLVMMVDAELERRVLISSSLSHIWIRKYQVNCRMTVNLHSNVSVMQLKKKLNASLRHIFSLL